MIKKFSILLLVAVAFFVTTCRERTVFTNSGGLPPPPLTSSLYSNDTLTLVWINENRDIEGFEGYHVYISANPGLENLPGDDSVLNLARVTVSPIGRTDDTVVARFAALRDGTPLSDVDSFFAHIRCVVNAEAGASDTEYVFRPALDTIPDSLALPVANLAFTVVNGQDGNPGGAVRLAWDPPTGSTPDEYVVSVDGVDYVPTTNTYETVNDPCAETAVYAVYGAKRSQAVTLDFRAIETASLDVWTTDDPDPSHPSGFGFSTAGAATTYGVSNQSSWPNIDYFMASGAALTSPNSHIPSPINTKGNGSCSETGSFEDLHIVSPTGQNLYLLSRTMAINELYGLWLDANDNGYDVSDHFGKIFVTAISGMQITLRLVYQTVPGLRWVVTQ